MAQQKQPNILFIMSDDHAAHAISAYGSRINKTPNLDRIANEGMRFEHCYCTNSICTPSRATILTGQHSHKNDVYTLADAIDGRRDCLVQKHLQNAGYQTAMIGKWHLGRGGNADPTGFDYWNVLPGQGYYHNPFMRENGQDRRYTGYVSEIITDLTLDWLKNQRDPNKPFCMMMHHKAPHRPWIPGENYQHLYEDEDIPEPDTLWDDYSNRAKAAEVAKMRMEDLNEGADLKQPVPRGLSWQEERRWRYQRYIKDYLRTIASIDDSVGSVLDYLEEQGLTDDTIVIYTSDQGFFLGDHNWFDKRFMYEESYKMPFVVRYPREIEAGSVCHGLMSNLDFAATMLDYAGADVPSDMQGVSARPLFRGETPSDWQQSVYYRYWMHGETAHNSCAHYGVRTARYKLIYWYAQKLVEHADGGLQLEPEWELFDCERDPNELNNVYHDPAYAETVRELTAELERLQAQYEDEPVHEPAGARSA